MKTPGQILYEYQHPPYVRVVLVSRRAFATEADVFLVPNPAEPTPWKFITKASQATYERQAEGHHIFSKPTKE